MTPQHPSSPPTAPLQPETEPRFWVYYPNPHLMHRDRTTPPPPSLSTCHHATPTHHPPSPFHAACLKPSHNSSVLSFGPTPLPALHFASAPPPLHHHRLVRVTMPTPSTIPHCCYEHGLSAAKDALNHGPTGTHRSHGRM